MRRNILTKFTTVILLLTSKLYAITFYPTDKSPMFSDYNNQVSGYFGVSSKTWYFETKMFSTFWRYSQPNKFFRLPGRISFETGYMFGFEDKKRNINYGQYTQMLFGFSQDVLIFYTESTYIGVGLGGYIKTRDEYKGDVTVPRVQSLFTFGVSAFLGQKITNNTNLELFYKHFSNGKLERPNIGHNFVGLAINYNFL